MKVSEATKVIGAIIQWQMVLQGVVERDSIKSDLDLRKYSLEDLIKANKLVESNNRRKRKMQEYWRNKKGSANGISQQMTLADRLIAGVYVALNFPATNEVHVLINDIGVGNVVAKYDK